MKRTVITAALFAIFAVLYFSPLDFPYLMAIPLALLALGSVGRLPWQLCLAFALSCLGDAASYWREWLGPDTAFLAKVANFAIAHIFFVAFFLRQWSRKLSRKPWHLSGIIAITLALVIFVMLRVVPEVPAGALSYGVAGYCLIISAMLFSALMTRDWVWGIGAILFVYSDFILAWNSFCAPVPGERYLIMVPYFGAQLLFFVRAMSKAKLGYKLRGSAREN